MNAEDPRPDREDRVRRVLRASAEQGELDVCGTPEDATAGGWPQRDPLDEESPFGSYFVSAYPPFAVWREDALPAVDSVLLHPAPDDVPLGLYVHVPFCVQRCSYCYYLSYDDRPEAKADYLDALGRELGLYVARPYLAGRRPTFVYVGGGTPSSLSAHESARLFDGLRAEVPWDDVEEVTFECAPQTVTARKLRVLRDAGVNRVSLGVQQLDDDVLRANGRVHLTDDVLRAYALLREAGFEQVNLDLMVGLVGETESTFHASLERVLALEPDGVTLYLLEIPRNTPLYRRLRDDPDAPRPASWREKRARLRRAFERVEQAGYTARSAYTLVRDPTRHRFVYQDALYRGADLVGLGASAFSYLGGVHAQNHARLGSYLDRVGCGRLPLARAHALDSRERLLRELVLQLKLGRVDVAALRARHGVDPLAVFGAPLERCRDAGWLNVDRDEIVLTSEGRPRVDRLVLELYPPHHRRAVAARQGVVRT